ncbi:nuclear transport factor 2 family protein [Arenibaculum sp.]|uniref:nuclear transport factor 2 family protein n=1 Tax=Arenibaculum sp. TaxID=2865862 RepID=UPI0039C8822E
MGASVRRRTSLAWRAQEPGAAGRPRRTDACLELWRRIATQPGTRFEPEDVTVMGDRAIIRWRYFWGEGEDGCVRGVNLMRVRDGLIVEAMGYVKGA